MDRPTSRVTALPLSEVELHAWSPSWARLLPLWRHAVWAGLFFVVCALSVSVRLDVVDLHKDLARNARLQREAVVLNERLRLEWAVRRRTASIEALAGAMGLSEHVPMIPVEGRP